MQGPSYTTEGLEAIEESLGETTFGAYEGRWLMASNPASQTVTPAKRALDFQARRAHIRALREGWIDEARYDRYQSFGSDYGGKANTQWVLEYFERKAKDEKAAVLALIGT